MVLITPMVLGAAALVAAVSATDVAGVSGPQAVVKNSELQNQVYRLEEQVMDAEGRKQDADALRKQLADANAKLAEVGAANEQANARLVRVTDDHKKTAEALKADLDKARDGNERLDKALDEIMAKLGIEGGTGDKLTQILDNISAIESSISQLDNDIMNLRDACIHLQEIGTIAKDTKLPSADADPEVMFKELVEILRNIKARPDASAAPQGTLALPGQEELPVLPAPDAAAAPQGILALPAAKDEAEQEELPAPYAEAAPQGILALQAPDAAAAPQGILALPAPEAEAAQEGPLPAPVPSQDDRVITLEAELAAKTLELEKAQKEAASAAQRVRELEEQLVVDNAFAAAAIAKAEAASAAGKEAADKAVQDANAKVAKTKQRLAEANLTLAQGKKIVDQWVATVDGLRQQMAVAVSFVAQTLAAKEAELAAARAAAATATEELKQMADKSSQDAINARQALEDANADKAKVELERDELKAQIDKANQAAAQAAQAAQATQAALAAQALKDQAQKLEDERNAQAALAAQAAQKLQDEIDARKAKELAEISDKDKADADFVKFADQVRKSLEDWVKNKRPPPTPDFDQTNSKLNDLYQRTSKSVDIQNKFSAISKLVKALKHFKSGPISVGAVEAVLQKGGDAYSLAELRTYVATHQNNVDELTGIGYADDDVFLQHIRDEIARVNAIIEAEELRIKAEYDRQHAELLSQIHALEAQLLTSVDDKTALTEQLERARLDIESLEAARATSEEGARVQKEISDNAAKALEEDRRSLIQQLTDKHAELLSQRDGALDEAVAQAFFEEFALKTAVDELLDALKNASTSKDTTNTIVKRIGVQVSEDATPADVIAAVERAMQSFDHDKDALAATVARAESDIRALVSERDALTNEINNLAEQYENLEDESANATFDNVELRSKFMDAHKTVQDLRAKLVGVEGKIRGLEALNAALQSVVAEQDLKISDVIADNAALNVGVSASSQELETLKSDLARANSDLAKAKSDLSKLQLDSAATSEELRDAKAQITAAEARVLEAQRKQSIAEENLKVPFNIAVAPTTKELEDAKTALADLEKDSAATSEELRDAKAQIAAAEARVLEAQKKQKIAEENLKELDDAKVALAAKDEEIRNANAALAANQSATTDAARQAREAAEQRIATAEADAARLRKDIEDIEGVIGAPTAAAAQALVNELNGMKAQLATTTAGNDAESAQLKQEAAAAKAALDAVERTVGPVQAGQSLPEAVQKALDDAMSAVAASEQRYDDAVAANAVAVQALQSRINDNERQLNDILQSVGAPPGQSATAAVAALMKQSSAEVVAVTAALTDTAEKLEDANRAVAALAQEKEYLTAQLESIGQGAALSDTRAQELQADIATVSTQLRDAEAAASKLRDELDVAVRGAQSSQELAAEANRAKDAALESAARLELEKTAAEERLTTIGVEIERVKAEKKALEEMLASTADTSGQMQSVVAQLQANVESESRLRLAAIAEKEAADAARVAAENQIAVADAARLAVEASDAENILRFGRELAEEKRRAEEAAVSQAENAKAAEIKRINDSLSPESGYAARIGAINALVAAGAPPPDVDALTDAVIAALSAEGNVSSVIVASKAGGPPSVTAAADARVLELADENVVEALAAMRFLGYTNQPVHAEVFATADEQLASESTDGAVLAALAAAVGKQDPLYERVKAAVLRRVRDGQRVSGLDESDETTAAAVVEGILKWDATATDEDVAHGKYLNAAVQNSKFATFVKAREDAADTAAAAEATRQTELRAALAYISGAKTDERVLDDAAAASVRDMIDLLRANGPQAAQVADDYEARQATFDAEAVEEIARFNARASRDPVSDYMFLRQMPRNSARHLAKKSGAVFDKIYADAVDGAKAFEPHIDQPTHNRIACNVLDGALDQLRLCIADMQSAYDAGKTDVLRSLIQTANSVVAMGPQPVLTGVERFYWMGCNTTAFDAARASVAGWAIKAAALDEHVREVDRAFAEIAEQKIIGLDLFQKAAKQFLDRPRDDKYTAAKQAELKAVLDQHCRQAVTDAQAFLLNRDVGPSCEAAIARVKTYCIDFNDGSNAKFDDLDAKYNALKSDRRGDKALDSQVDDEVALVDKAIAEGDVAHGTQALEALQEKDLTDDARRRLIDALTRSALWKADAENASKKLAEVPVRVKTVLDSGVSLESLLAEETFLNTYFFMPFKNHPGAGAAAGALQDLSATINAYKESMQAVARMEQTVPALATDDDVDDAMVRVEGDIASIVSNVAVKAVKAADAIKKYAASRASACRLSWQQLHAVSSAVEQHQVTIQYVPVKEDSPEIVGEVTAAKLETNDVSGRYRQKAVSGSKSLEDRLPFYDDTTLTRIMRNPESVAFIPLKDLVEGNWDATETLEVSDFKSGDGPNDLAWLTLGRRAAEMLNYLNIVWYSDAANMLKDPAVYGYMVREYCKSAPNGFDCQEAVKAFPNLFWVNEYQSCTIQVYCARAGRTLPERCRSVRRTDTAHYHNLLKQWIEKGIEKTSSDLLTDEFKPHKCSFITLEHCLQMAIEGCDARDSFPRVGPDLTGSFISQVATVINKSIDAITKMVDYVKASKIRLDEKNTAFKDVFAGRMPVLSYVRVSLRTRPVSLSVTRLPISSFTDVVGTRPDTAAPVYVTLPYHSQRYGRNARGCDRLTETSTLPWNDGTSKQFFSYHMGPFTAVLHPGLTNEDIATYHCGELLGALRTGRNIFVFGYGPSGAGKTSALIYFNGGDMKTPDELEVMTAEDVKAYEKSRQGSAGIIPRVIDKINSDDTNKVVDIGVRIVEYYSDGAAPTFKDLVAGLVRDSSLGYESCPEFLFDVRDSGVVAKDVGGLELQKELVGINARQGVDPNVKDKCQSYLKHIETLGGFITAHLDLRRRVEPTTNNRESSRSHAVIYMTLRRSNGNVQMFAVGDFAGVEKAFDCDNTLDDFEHRIVLRPSTLIQSRRNVNADEPKDYLQLDANKRTELEFDTGILPIMRDIRKRALAHDIVDEDGGSEAVTNAKIDAAVLKATLDLDAAVTNVRTLADIARQLELRTFLPYLKNPQHAGAPPDKRPQVPKAAPAPAVLHVSDLKKATNVGKASGRYKNTIIFNNTGTDIVRKSLLERGLEVYTSDKPDDEDFDTLAQAAMSEGYYSSDFDTSVLQKRINSGGVFIVADVDNSPSIYSVKTPAYLEARNGISPPEHPWGSEDDKNKANKETKVPPPPKIPPAPLKLKKLNENWDIFSSEKSPSSINEWPDIETNAKDIRYFNNWKGDVVNAVKALGLVPPKATDIQCLREFFVTFAVPGESPSTVMSAAAKKYQEWALKDIEQHMGLKKQCVTRTAEGRYIVASLDDLRRYLRANMADMISTGEYAVQYNPGCMAQICNPVYGDCASNIGSRASDFDESGGPPDDLLCKHLDAALGKTFLPVIMTVVNLEPEQPDDKPARNPYVDVQDIKHIMALRKFVGREGDDENDRKLVVDSRKNAGVMIERIADGLKPIDMSSAIRLLTADTFTMPLFDREAERRAVRLVQRRLAYLADATGASQIDEEDVRRCLNYLETLVSARDWSNEVAAEALKIIERINALSIVGCLEFTDQFSKMLNNTFICNQVSTEGKLLVDAFALAERCDATHDIKLYWDNNLRASPISKNSGRPVTLEVQTTDGGDRRISSVEFLSVDGSTARGLDTKMADIVRSSGLFRSEYTGDANYSDKKLLWRFVVDSYCAELGLPLVGDKQQDADGAFVTLKVPTDKHGELYKKSPFFRHLHAITANKDLALFDNTVTANLKTFGETLTHRFGDTDEPTTLPKFVSRLKRLTGTVRKINGFQEEDPAPVSNEVVAVGTPDPITPYSEIIKAVKEDEEVIDAQVRLDLATAEYMKGQVPGGAPIVRDIVPDAETETEYYSATYKVSAPQQDRFKTTAVALVPETRWNPKIKYTDFMIKMVKENVILPPEISAPENSVALKSVEVDDVVANAIAINAFIDTFLSFATRGTYAMLFTCVKAGFIRTPRTIMAICPLGASPFKDIVEVSTYFKTLHPDFRMSSPMFAQACDKIGQYSIDAKNSYDLVYDKVLSQLGKFNGTTREVSYDRYKQMFDDPAHFNKIMIAEDIYAVAHVLISQNNNHIKQIDSAVQKFINRVKDIEFYFVIPANVQLKRNDNKEQFVVYLRKNLAPNIFQRTGMYDMPVSTPSGPKSKFERYLKTLTPVNIPRVADAYLKNPKVEAVLQETPNLVDIITNVGFGQTTAQEWNNNKVMLRSSLIEALDELCPECKKGR